MIDIYIQWSKYYKILLLQYNPNRNVDAALALLLASDGARINSENPPIMQIKWHYGVTDVLISKAFSGGFHNTSFVSKSKS